MLQKLPILTFLYFIPLIYLSNFLVGFSIGGGFLNTLMIACALAIIIILLSPFITFLTVKSNIITKVVLGAVLIFAFCFLIKDHFGILLISSGYIRVFSNPLNIASFRIDSLGITIIASFLLALWGIIMNLLLH